MTANADKAAESVVRFQAWAADREKAGDWADYIRGGRLNRSELAKECQFGRAAWQQNPALAKELAELERQLAARGALSAAPVDVGRLAPEVQAELGMSDEKVRRAMSARASLEKRVKSLEEQNAALRAENRDLRERLRRSALADIHLAETGRLLP
jgi:chromosome segregation ATPase